MKYTERYIELGVLLYDSIYPGLSVAHIRITMPTVVTATFARPRWLRVEFWETSKYDLVKELSFVKCDRCSVIRNRIVTLCNCPNF